MSASVLALISTLRALIHDVSAGRRDPIATRDAERALIVLETMVSGREAISPTGHSARPQLIRARDASYRQLLALGPHGSHRANATWARGVIARYAATRWQGDMNRIAKPQDLDQAHQIAWSIMRLGLPVLSVERIRKIAR